MIIDDELRQVRALSAIIRRLRPEYRILEASDVQTAWDIIMQAPVDAVLTDIRMPEEDGLTLTERIASQKPHIRTVLISGYGQFDYAQKAIEHRVIEYLIKPIGLADIERVLAKLEELSAQDIEHKELNKERYWYDILTGACSGQQRRLTFSHPYADRPGLVIVLELSGANAADRMPALRAHWTTVNPMLGHCETVQVDQRLVTLVWLNRNLAAKPSDTIMTISRLLENIRLCGHEDLSAGVSRVRSILQPVVQEAYHEARLALSHRFYTPADTIVWGSDVQAFTEKVTPSAKEITEPLISAIRAGERQRALELVNTFFRQRDSLPYPDPARVRDEVGHMVWQLLHSLENLLSAESEAGDHVMMRKKLIQCRDYRETRLQFKALVLRLLELSEQANMDKNGLLILRCQNYLHQHYMDDISLESVAAMFHFNASYFSNLFKQRTGMNFSEYLLHLRINKAKLMLEQSNDKISCISERSGFRTAAYFNKMFKRETGISPKTFRQMQSTGAAE